jgi:hypothetical protein
MAANPFGNQGGIVEDSGECSKPNLGKKIAVDAIFF